MREGDGPLTHPVPWAASPETSFVESSASYTRLLAAAGFEVIKERSRREFAVSFFQELRARIAQSGAPPFGLHILMGAATPQKIGNMVRALERGLISPTKIICRAT